LQPQLFERISDIIAALFAAPTYCLEQVLSEACAANGDAKAKTVKTSASDFMLNLLD
jgi:hypothetical protein